MISLQFEFEKFPLNLEKMCTKYVQQPILKLNVNINFVFSDLVDDVDSLTEDDLKSIAMEQMETAQETNETEKARWQKYRQTVQRLWAPDFFIRILPSCFRLVRDCSCPKTAKESRTCQLSKEN